MRGKPRYNFARFARVAKALRRRGIQVMSPAEHDLEQGFEPTCPVVDEKFVRDALRWDLAMIIDGADAIVVLPDWEASEGVAVELHVARAIGLPVYQWPSMRPLLAEDPPGSSDVRGQHQAALMSAPSHD
jgi:hypothetical protein